MIKIINRYFNYNKINHIIQLGSDKMLISIVGKSGAGKSSIIKRLAELNPKIKHLDIDKVGHYVNDIPLVQNALKENFGENIIENGKVNRSTLAKIVFSNNNAMEELASITWPSMERLIDSFLEENKENIIILDWQLLPKTKYFKKSILKILVTAPYDIRKERILKRDKISSEKFLERENASIKFNPRDYDEIINNIGNIESEVSKIYEKSIISREF